MTRVETAGSIWMIDNDLRRYCRFPKQEQPREHPEWGGPEAGALQDAVWHDFAGEWAITPSGRLLIQVEYRDDPGDWWTVSAPHAWEMTDVR